MTADILLLGLDLHGRDVLVVGGGAVGTRRARTFLDAGARVRVVAPAVSGDLAGLIAAGRVRHDARAVRDSDLDGAWLVHTATGDRAVDARVRDAAEARRIWCVDATDAARTPARLPARARIGTVDGPVDVAVLTGQPRRSAQLRDRLVALLSAGTVVAFPRATRQSATPARTKLKEVS